jgi:tight adherence protein C
VTLLWIAAAGIFILMMTVSMGVYAYLISREQRRDWKRRVEFASTLSLEPGPDTGFDLLVARVVSFLQRLGEATKPKNEKELSSLRQTLLTAGYRKPYTALVFYGVKLCCSLSAVVVLALVPLSVLRFPSTNILLLLYIGSAAAGYYLPHLWLRLAVRRRQHRILCAIPDALDLLVVCVEAGLGLDGAIARVGDELKLSGKDLADEFYLLSLELRAGASRQDALRNLARRTDLEEMKTLVALLVQTDRFGTSVGQALRVHAESMRVARRLKAEALAAKVPVKLLFPLIFFIFPSLFVVVMGPVVVKVVRVLLPGMTGVGQ